MSASRRVARALRSRGFGRGMRVGLCLWRSPLTVIAQFGILRSGAAYVPLDSSYPAERIAYMVQDSGLRAVISERPLLPVLARAQGYGGVAWTSNRILDERSETGGL